MKVLVCFLIAVPGLALAEVHIDNPIRGWRMTSDPTNTVQRVTYPASSVNNEMEGSPSVANQIRGHISTAPKDSLLIEESPHRPDVKRSRIAATDRSLSF